MCSLSLREHILSIECVLSLSLSLEKKSGGVTGEECWCYRQLSQQCLKAARPQHPTLFEHLRALLVDDGARLLEPRRLVPLACRVWGGSVTGSVKH